MAGSENHIAIRNHRLSTIAPFGSSMLALSAELQISLR